ncbi:MAG: amino acid ABC transporter substrate-binding protein [Thermodesulfobacteriota bacterium]
MKHALAALAILAALAAAAVLSGLFRAGEPVAPAASGPLRIGVSLSLTGRYAALGEQQHHAFQLWVRQQNAAGGLNGRPVELVARDDASDPQTARDLYLEFIRQDRTDFLFAPYSSEITRAVAPLAEEHGYPLIASGASADSLWDAGNTLLFGLFTPASRYAQGMLEILLKSGVNRLAVITFPGLFPAEACHGLRVWAQRLGMELSFSCRVEGPGLTEAVAAARASGAQALLVCGYPNDAVAARRAVQAVGWRPRAFFATVGPSLEAYGKELGPLAEGGFGSSHWEPDLPYPGTAEFTREFTLQYGHPPSYQAAGAYAAGQVLAQAAANAGSLDRRRVAEALSVLDTTTVLGPFAVDRRGMQTRHFAVVVQWQGGRKAVVWPEKLATAEPRFPFP